MKRRISKIDPVQLAKILGIIYALCSLLFVPFFFVFSALASMAPEGSEIAMPAMLGVGFGFLLLAPIIYGAMGFICGLILALIYNVIAGWIGGIQIELEEVPEDKEIENPV